MKKLLLLCACLLALASPLRALADPPADIVVVRIYDYDNYVKIITTKGEGDTEKIETKSMNYDKGAISVNEAYYKVLKKFYQEGYILQNSSTISSSNGVGRVTYILVKNR